MIRVCVIGAGPCGLSTLLAFKKLAKEGKLKARILSGIECFKSGAAITRYHAISGFIR